MPTNFSPDHTPPGRAASYKRRKAWLNAIDWLDAILCGLLFLLFLLGLGALAIGLGLPMEGL